LLLLAILVPRIQVLLDHPAFGGKQATPQRGAQHDIQQLLQSGEPISFHDSRLAAARVLALVARRRAAGSSGPGSHPGKVTHSRGVRKILRMPLS